nr:hypothetical protein [Nostoc sp. EkiNYC01]
GQCVSGPLEPLIEEVPVDGDAGHRGRGSVLVQQLMEEIRQLIPSDVATLEKIVVGLQVQDDQVRLSFQNDPDVCHSVVLACDGADGVARKIVLANQHGASKPSFTSDYKWERFMSMKAAQETLGNNIARNGNVFCGYGGYIVTCPVRVHGVVCVYVLSVHESRRECPNGAPPHLCNPDDITMQDFQFWTSSIRHISTGVQTSKKSPIFATPDAPNYFRGRICLLGEAAHGGSPHEDALVGVYLEDAYLMGALCAKNSRDYPAVFSSFEKVRRIRGQALTKASRDAGRILQLRQPGVRDDLRELRRNLSTRQSWVWSWNAFHDLNEATLHQYMLQTKYETEDEAEGDICYDFCE